MGGWLCDLRSVARMWEKIGVGEWLEQWGGWIVSGLTILGTFIYNSRRVEVDESAMVLGKWKELVEAHQSQIGSLKAEIAELRERLMKTEARIRELEEINSSQKIAYEQQIAGLQRQIAQNSRAAVHALHKTNGAPGKDKP
jgi:hypothetical protein